MVYSKVLQTISETLNIAIRARAKLFWGDEMIVVLPDSVSASVFRFGFVEEGLTAFVLEHLKPGMIFFDVGAHFGYFTLLGAMLVGMHGQVHSFEPTRSTFSVLRENTESRQNIHTENVVVWSETTTVRFNDFGQRFLAFNSIYAPRGGEKWKAQVKTHTYQVQAISIDDYVANSGVVPNFIKIDAESAEYEILRGMEKTIAKHRPIVSVEVGDVNIDGAASSKDVVGHVLERGYRALGYEEGRIVDHRLRERYEYDNVLLVPDEVQGSSG